MDQEPNKIHENVISTKINYHIIQYKLLYIYVTTNTNMHAL